MLHHEPSTIPQRYPETYGQRYLLPCPILGLGGLYEYCLIDAREARRWLESGPYRSFVTHPLLRLALERLCAVETSLPVRLPWPVLGYHDDALVFQVSNYETLPQQLTGCSTLLRQMIDQGAYTLGLLRRLA